MSYGVEGGGFGRREVGEGGRQGKEGGRGRREVGEGGR